MANIFNLRKCRIIVELQLERTKVLLMIGGEILVVNIRCCRCIEVTNAEYRRRMDSTPGRKTSGNVVAIRRIQLREHIRTSVVHSVGIEGVLECVYKTACIDRVISDRIVTLRFSC